MIEALIIKTSYIEIQTWLGHQPLEENPQDTLRSARFVDTRIA